MKPCKEQPLLACHNVGKTFGPVVANRGINLTVFAGEILAILGENGAGKSTLMSIIAGRYKPNTGWLEIDGKEVSFSSPAQALNSGIGMVYQRFMLIEPLTVAENILLAADSCGNNLSLSQVKIEIQTLCDRYGLDIDADQRVSNLSMGERQRTEILKLLIQSAKLLIFDEPTAVLAEPDVHRFFTIVDKLKKDGRGIIFITHKLEEVMALADRIAILRRGEIVTETTPEKAADKRQLAQLMVGKELQKQLTRPRITQGETIIEVRDLCYLQNRERGSFQRLSFTINRGEILSIIGVAGNGQDSLCQVIAGNWSPSSGTIRFLGASYSPSAWSARKNTGIAYVPEDRHSIGSISSMDLAENYLLTRLDHIPKGFLLDAALMQREIDCAIKEFGIVAHSSRTLAGQLSGGNLQKLILARELARQPALFIAEQPTQGLDIAATQEVWRAILAQREDSAVLIFTGDIKEALTLSDKIGVIFDGQIAEIIDTDDTTAVSRIGLLMAGAKT